MNKFQDVSFSHVGELLDYLPSDQLEITEMLRRLVFETLPHVREKLSFNVPFFYRRNSICLIWPGAVPWGKHRKEGVEFALTHADKIPFADSYFEKGKRKMVFNRRFYHPSDIDTGILASFLLEAAEIDEARWQARRKK
jgi:hypothetical protein